MGEEKKKVSGKKKGKREKGEKESMPTSCGFAKLFYSLVPFSEA